MTSSFRCIAAAVLLASLAPAQQLSVTITPNPAPVGTPITVTAQAIVPGLFTPFGCLLSSVRSGMPNGPTVAIFGCTFLPVAIPPCGGAAFRTGIWSQSVLGGGMAAPGHYWLEIQRSPQMFGPITSEWFCVTIHDPVLSPVPALSAVNAPMFGSVFQMSLNAPGHGFEPYGVALSVTTNAGIPIPGGHACLDNDFLFNFSLTQDPNFFLNFSGALDATGLSPAISLFIPPLTGITCLPLHAQAAVIAPGGAIILSNGLAFTVK